MARLPRLALAGQAHWLIQRAHSGCTVFVDDIDRQHYLSALTAVAAGEQVQIHAFALLDGEVQLLATPSAAASLSRLMQALGRRYVSAHHRRHGGSGTLWEGRFRCAVVEPGSLLLDVLVLIEGQPGETGATSLEHRLGSDGAALLVDPPEFWQLGNTPFERQDAWRHRVERGLPAETAAALRKAALGGWVVGSAAFAAAIGERAQRPPVPRKRGRPPLQPR